MKNWLYFCHLGHTHGLVGVFHVSWSCPGAQIVAGTTFQRLTVGRGRENTRLPNVLGSVQKSPDGFSSASLFSNKHRLPIFSFENNRLWSYVFFMPICLTFLSIFSSLLCFLRSSVRRRECACKCKLHKWLHIEGNIKQITILPAKWGWNRKTERKKILAVFWRTILSQEESNWVTHDVKRRMTCESDRLNVTASPPSSS
jgi:hypothetical protein